MCKMGATAASEGLQTLMQISVLKCTTSIQEKEKTHKDLHFFQPPANKTSFYRRHTRALTRAKLPVLTQRGSGWGGSTTHTQSQPEQPEQRWDWLLPGRRRSPENSGIRQGSDVRGKLP